MDVTYTPASGLIYTFTPPATPVLFVNPGTVDFGYVPFGSSKELSYVLSGAHLTAGPIVVNAPIGFGVFMVSLTSGGPYTSSVNVSYTPPTLGNTTIYVKFTPAADGQVYSNLFISNFGGGATNNVWITGSSYLYGSYCASSATSTADEDIFNVTIGTINNSSTCATLAPGVGSVQNEYSNYFFDVAPANLARSTSPNFSVQVGTCGTVNYSNAVKIFIDFNQNGSFADAGEEVYVSAASTSGAHVETGSITIPVGATLGNTMMRVVNVETTTPSSITPCGTYGYGETEDYKVNITAAPACPPPMSLVAGSITAHTANLSWTKTGTETHWEYTYGVSP